MSTPESSHNAVNTEMDPRQKPGGGLDFWAAALLKAGLIGQKSYNEFTAKNNAKEGLMEERKLPQLKHYGYFESVEAIRDKIKPEEGEKFIIRCASKDNDVDIKRLLDATLDEVCEFAKELPGGFERWRVEVKEFVNTKAAGTIIVAPNGETKIEMWHGPHYLNTTDCPKYYGNFDPEQFDMHFNWRAPGGAEDLADMQDYSLSALRRFFPYVKPKEHEPIYAEYGVRQNGSVYFIEANDSEFLTGK